MADKREGPFAGWLRWGNIATTLALALLVYTYWRDSRSEAELHERERAQIEARLAVAEAAIRQHIESDRVLQGAIEQRLDVQREDIRALQGSVIRHVETGQQRNEQRGR